MDRPRVLIAVPNEGWICKAVVRALFPMLQDQRYESIYMDPTWKPCEYNRARCHEEAVRRDFDWLLMMDADNPPMMGNPMDLIALDKDVIACPTLVYGKHGIYWNCMDYVEKGTDGMPGFLPHEECEGLQEVDAVGSGLILVSRRVLVSTQFDQPWMRRWDSRGFATMGTDWAFCMKAKAKGYRVWAHYDYRCEHYKEHAAHEFAMAAIEGFSDGR